MKKKRRENSQGACANDRFEFSSIYKKNGRLFPSKGRFLGSAGNIIALLVSLPLT